MVLQICNTDIQHLHKSPSFFSKMASFGIHSGSNLLRPSFSPQNKPNQLFSSNPFLPISNKTKKPQNHFISASIQSSNPTLDYHHPGEIKDGASEKIDSWIQESVSEIVKNLKKAPLLVQVYSENENGEKVKIQTDRASLENWTDMKGGWRNGESKSPDGLIFVEELGQDYDQDSLGQYLGESVSRAWGIVIQGKGVEYGSACYLLKTNRVCAGMGLGFCTHFCLMRVNNLRDSVFDQFMDSWLLQ
ncbi:hypothetical protein CASFOL_003073 [Castilleja foliolosa]|uniref:DUF7804 domain-containing protein n=1 Tax=Castilleja foliolosa TaxID=1961234 RepID=A0ABD3EI10_9LAMI